MLKEVSREGNLQKFEVDYKPVIQVFRTTEEKKLTTKKKYCYFPQKNLRSFENEKDFSDYYRFL